MSILKKSIFVNYELEMYMKILKKQSKFINKLSNKKENFGECQFEKYLCNMNIMIKGGRYEKFSIFF